MNYNKVAEAYSKKDIEWLKRNVNTYECRMFPLLGAHGDLERYDDTVIDICYWLFENGVDVNAVEGNGNCGLIIAASENKEKYIKMYLDNGADVNKKGEKGVTPLMVALNKKASEKIVKMLIDAGADLNQILLYNGIKISVIEQACYYGSLELLEYILEHGSLIKKQKEAIDNIEWDNSELDKKIQIMLKEYEKIQKSSNYKPKELTPYKNEEIINQIDFDYDGTLQIVKDTCKKITEEARNFRNILNEKLDPVRCDEDNYDLDGIIELITDSAEEQGDRFVEFIDLMDKSTRVPFEQLKDFSKIQDVYLAISKSIRAFDSINIDWGFKKYHQNYIYPIPSNIKEIQKYWKKLLESMPEYSEHKTKNKLSEILLLCLGDFDKMVTVSEMCEYEYSLSNYSLTTLYDELNKLCESGKIKKQIINKKSYFILIK